QLRGALEPAAEREAAPLLGVDPDVLEHLRVDHACPTQLDPAGELAHPAASAAAIRAGDVRLDRRLREGEVVRAEADLAFLAEQGTHHMQERPLEIGERDSVVDREALELMEAREDRR